MERFERFAFAVMFGVAGFAIPLIIVVTGGPKVAFLIARSAFENPSESWPGSLLSVATPALLVSFSIAIGRLRPFPLGLSVSFASAAALLFFLSLGLPSQAPIRNVGYLAGIALAIIGLRAVAWAKPSRQSRAA